MKQEQEEKQEQEQEQEKEQEKASRDRDINMIMDGYKDIGKQMLARHPKTKNPDQFFDLMLQQFPFLGVDKFFCSVFPSIAGIILAERESWRISINKPPLIPLILPPTLPNTRESKKSGR
jgi:hypothetical protein